MNGDFENLKAKTQAYIWVIWEKDYKGETITRWIQKAGKEWKKH